ncbi:MAG: sugar ABC transporter permease [Actinobacteria bacterium BACL2 MAG-121001-bin67]|uniref:Sugar ABC transporter permease n=2 Tax=ac1 cluster TaxID=1655545 RepID=A0A0R2P5F7_9ACTN|nr:MAG: sugar ABC transporter permease [Actinobacteria bacterium BACL2 MAG-121001-bin67]KRO54093.1 MAG: sugar ABC transporter permease [Actinobacteria bacterium BACL2 MAG-120820-bin50]KRO60382.1 MAG: sugar ABC transporter permease [Pelagibacteraceae bacterium BACL5 MAG-120705-bin12]KRO74551.1 MAG: sugar ABC transporter permease [Actinobacteria bacterium BACL2 MAG-120920-bin34]KRP31387.1 MAG: sugar ABC transporter permease [Actinobacteria bacterium BACL2 MAG-120507-bin38]
MSKKRPPSTGEVLRTASLLALSFVVLAPVSWFVLSSFKDLTDFSSRPPMLFPTRWATENYSEAFAMYDYTRYFLNSLFVTVVATLLTLVINSMAAFAFAKYNFRGKDGLFILTLAMIMIPLQVILIPMYLVVSSLGLVNTYWGMIIPAAATPTGVFVIRQYMLTIPDELLESARMDGAGEFRIYARIVMPLARPALAVVAIFSILWRWNDFLWPLLIAQEERLYTLPVALALLNGQLVVPYTIVLAMSVMSIVPVLFMFVFMQRQIIQGIAHTGIK